MRMSCFSKIQMSCFAADAMLGVSGLIAGARHACSRTGDTEHARTRPSEGDPGRGGDGTEDLTVDGSRNPPVAVAPDIQFVPTVSYGNIITANRGSRLTLTLKNGSIPAECDGSKPAQ